MENFAATITHIRSNTLQRRHYELIAMIIAAMPDVERYVTAHHFADELTVTQRNFDRVTFLRACGVHS